MKRIKLTLIAAAFAIAGTAFAQNSNNKWLIGVGAHAVDFNSVRPTFCEYFQTDNYSIVPPLSKLTIGRSLSKSFALDLSASVGEVDYTRNEVDFIKDEFFINAGLGLKYKLANDYILSEDSWFDPYLRVGANYTQYDFGKSIAVGAGHMDEENFATVSGGAGFNIWLAQNFGINVESNYNWMPVATGDHQDFFQHSAGLVFRFGGKDTDKDGIPDNKDKCPEVFGLKEFEGCPDTDKDGITDAEDQCPELAGPKENNGCPDTDGDGLYDNVDNCPTEFGPQENNGCPWGDADGDGLKDNVDKCPNQAGPSENNGCPWGDKDGDGFKDNVDKCPTKAGVAPDGCPTIETDVTERTREVLFNYGSATIRPESAAKLDAAAEILKKDGRTYLLVGTTDKKGSEAYNLKLSQQRAQAVVKALEQRGVNPDQLKSIGVGETEAVVAETASNEERMKDRRVYAKYIITSDWEKLPKCDIPAAPAKKAPAKKATKK